MVVRREGRETAVASIRSWGRDQLTTRASPRRKRWSRDRRAVAGNEKKRLALTAREANPAALKQRFEKAIEQGRPLCVHAGAVDALSTADVQILLAAAMAAQARALEFRVVAPSTPFVAAFGDLGLREILDSWCGVGDASPAP